MRAVTRTYQAWRNRIFGRITMRGSLRFARHLYQLAENPSEVISVTGFITKYVIACLVPRFFAQQDATIRLQGTTYVVGIKSMEIFTLEELYYLRAYERETDFIPRAGWTVFDVGANAGFFAAQQVRRHARVFAFEPNPDCYRRLTQLVTKNGWANSLHLSDNAVAASPDTGVIRVPSGWTGVGSIVPRHSDVMDRAMPVTITSLDHIVPTLGVAHIDLLKIDVEGAEADVLSGAAQTLPIVDRIVLEYHSPHLLQQVVTLLRRHQFVPIKELPVDEGAGIGILYARRSA